MKTLYTNIKIPATSGQKTIAKSKLFSYIDSDFNNYGTDKPDRETEESTLSVLETERDGTSQQFFGEISNDTDSLCLTQEQILYFVENEKDKLHPDWGTFFLFKSNEEFFVADVYRLVDGLEVFVYRLSYDFVWFADYRLRLVVPQMNSASRKLEISHSDAEIGRAGVWDLENRIKKLEEQVDSLRKFLVF